MHQYTFANSNKTDQINVCVSNDKSTNKCCYIIGRCLNMMQIIDEKRIIFVGGTSSGKTTMIKAMINYLYDIDANNNERFEIIHKENVIDGNR